MLVKLYYYTTYLVSKIFSLVLIFSWKKWWKTNIRWKLWSHENDHLFLKRRRGITKKSLYFKKYRGTDDVLCRIRFKSFQNAFDDGHIQLHGPNVPLFDMMNAVHAVCVSSFVTKIMLEVSGIKIKVYLQSRIFFIF